MAIKWRKHNVIIRLGGKMSDKKCDKDKKEKGCCGGKKDCDNKKGCCKDEKDRNSRK